MENIDYFDDMLANILSNKKFKPIVTELFILARKLNLSLVFIIQSCFVTPKNVWLNSTHYCSMKIQRNKIFSKFHLTIYQLLIIDPFIINLYKRCPANPYFFYWLMLLKNLVTVHVSERIFENEYK